MEKIKVHLENVERTLFLPLWARAEESKREQGVLKDDMALEIIERVDLDVEEMTRKMDDLSRVAWIMRSVYCDEVIRGFLAEHPGGTVVNIGCGLDTTFERVDNGKLKWYDVDLPDVMVLRERFITPGGRRQFISSSFLEEGWLEQIDGAEALLFMAAGVLYYFSEQQVRDFMMGLAGRFTGCRMLFDACSRMGIETANQMVIRSSGLDEKSFLQWSLEHAVDLEDWDSRFHVLQTFSYYAKSRVPMSLRTRILGRLSDALRIQYLVYMDTRGGLCV